MKADDISFLSGDVVAAARRLLGCVLVREVNGVRLGGRIVETEAYHRSDAASHSYKGETPRTAVMFGPAGRVYVYFTYGMHYCMNIVTGPTGEGSAVLIRALEPLDGLENMRRNRGNVPDGQLTNGPAKLCQAMGVTREQNGVDVLQGPVYLEVTPPLPDSAITVATRIGISRDAHRLWRFYVAASPFVSKR